MRVFFSILASSAFVWAGDHWPQWRGPSLDGTTDSTNLPVTWSEKENIKWKVKLPSWSGSTPAVWGDRILVMSPSAPGTGPDAPNVKKMAGDRKPEGQDLLLICLSKKNGSELWKTKLAGGNYQIGKQNMSSPSPITDGKMIWASTGLGILSALDLSTGKVLWQFDLQQKFGKFGLNWGYGSSPLLFDNKLIVPVLHGMTTRDPSYLVALDPKDGKIVWRVERPTDAKSESPDSYITPVPLRYPNRSEILILGGDYVTGHDPKTGREVWRCGGVNPQNSTTWRTIASPAVVGGAVFVSVKRGPLVACKGGGQGIVTKSHTLWTGDTGCDVPTPVSDGKYLYVLDDDGLLSCVDPKTGNALYKKERLARGKYSASPLYGDGKIYCTSERAQTTVVAAGPQFKILAQNPLDDDYTLSSIAVSGSELFVRTSTYLYCIGR